MKCHILRALAHCYYAIDVLVEDVAIRIISAFLFMFGIAAVILLYNTTESLFIAIFLPSTTVCAMISATIICGYIWRKTGPIIYGKSEACDRGEIPQDSV